MKTARELPAKDYLSLKNATRKQTRASGGSRKAAGHTRVGWQHLDKCGNADDEELETTFLSLDVVADIESITGRPLITEALAALTGHVLVHLPDVAKTTSPLGRITAEALKESSDVFVALGKRLADGRITKREFADIHIEIREALAALARLDKQIEAEVGGE